MMVWRDPFIPRRWSLYRLVSIANGTELSSHELSQGKPFKYTQFEYVNKLTGKMHLRITSGHYAEYYRKLASALDE